MRNIISPILFCSFLFCYCQVRNPARPDPAVVVVELFTSEGCSSCPPAESLVAEVSKKYRDGLILLSYHVDYWNYLGWKDTFSKALFSERQKKYADFLGRTDIYTPQVIVNGESEMVGSDKEKLLKTIDEDLKKKPTEHISLTARLQGTQVIIHCQHSLLKNCLIQLSLIQKKARTYVLKGENGGRFLDHLNIVRSVKNLDPADAGGSIAMDLPEGLNGSDICLIAFAQDRKSNHILAAAKAEIE